MVITNSSMTMIRGDTEAFYVSCKENGATRSFIAGDKVYFTVKKYASSSEIILQKIIDSFTDGKALIEISPENTSELEIAEYVYDIQITFKDGMVKTVMGPASFSLTAEVTYE